MNPSSEDSLGTGREAEAEGLRLPNATSPEAESSYESLLAGLLEGDRGALARSITIVESRRPADAVTAARLLDDCLGHGRSAFRVGFTGVPGVGKSSLIEVLGEKLLGEDHRIAVLAVDPSSTLSRGSILADKTRMPILASHPNAFVRPSPTGGHAGGTARATREAIMLCEAAGYDLIFIETVGVGQSETSVFDTVDFFTLMVLTGAGDELQGMKRGVLELADAILVSKCDGENVSEARRTDVLYREATHVFPGRPFGWRPRVLPTSTLTREGLDEFWETVQEYRRESQNSGFLDENRRRQAVEWMRDTLAEALRQALLEESGLQAELKGLEHAVKTGLISPRSAVHRLMIGRGK